MKLFVGFPQLAETLSAEQRELLAGDPEFAAVATLGDRIREEGISSTGALFQALQGSPDAEVYQDLARDVLDGTSSFDDARADLEGVLAKLELSRVEAEYRALATRPATTDAERAHLKAVSARLSELKGAGRVGTVPPV
jgi:hypothetical protein